MRKLAVVGMTALAIAIAGITAPAQATIRPDDPFGNGYIWTTNGHGYAIGATSLAAGTPIIQVQSPGRLLNFTFQTTYQGMNAGYIKLSNGNYVAMNNACTGVTIKSDPTSNGTIWAWDAINNLRYRAVSRYCDQQQAGRNLSAGNVLGQQWIAANPTDGQYQDLTVTPQA